MRKKRLISATLSMIMIVGCFLQYFVPMTSASSISEGSWSSWSDWSTDYVNELYYSGICYRQVETKTQYTYYHYSIFRKDDTIATYPSDHTVYNKGSSVGAWGSECHSIAVDSPLTYYGEFTTFDGWVTYDYIGHSCCQTYNGDADKWWYGNGDTTPTTRTVYRYRTRTLTQNYIVSYNANGGTGAPSSQTKTNTIKASETTYNALTLSSSVPTKAYTITFDANGGTCSVPTKNYSCTFTNWNTSSNGSGTSYSKGGTFNSSADTTLYAQWTNPTYGTLPTPTKSSARFDGWYTSAAGGTKVTNTGTVTSARTLYAHWTDQYTVNFDANGGSGAPEAFSYYADDSKVTLPESKPIKSYKVIYDPNGGTCSTSSQNIICTFKNWNVLKNGTGLSWASGANYIADSSATLYAQWTNNAVGTLPSATRTGYSFDGWYTAASGGTKVTSSTIVSANVTYYAHWTACNYAIAFNGNGSTSGSMSNLSMTYDAAKALTANAFTKTGYTFAGWNTKADGTGSTYTDKASVKNLATTGTVTLYAQWKANSYTIVFSGNGSTSGPMSNLSMTYDAAKTLTANVFIKTGYTFTGWNTKADGTGNTYADKASVKNLATTGTVTLYAQWSANPYTVTFNVNGGTCPTASKSVTYGSTYGTLPSATKTGYTFSGWYTSLTDGTQISVDTAVTITDAQTLYAHWTANNYTIAFNGNSSTSGSMSSLSMTYDAAKVLTANAFAKTGYTFAGWNTKTDGTGSAYADKASVKNLAATGTVTLYAQWKANSYAIAFNGNGSTSGSMSSLSMTYDAAKVLNANAFAKTGYTFAGWNTKADGTGSAYADKASIKNLTATGTVTLYAQWSANPYTVTFNANGGTCSTASKSVTYDKKYGELPICKIFF